jgi:hypothetical protein
VDQTSGTTPAGAPPQAPDSGQPDGPEAAGASAAGAGFGARGRVRRRARFLRKARELAYRDLGGLVFNLHRFGQRNDALVLNKLTTLGHIDAELRTLEVALGERETVTVLREAGITACPRCAAIHSGDHRFCPNCGLSMGRHVDLPIAGPPAATVTPSPLPAASPASAAPAAAAVESAPPSGPTTASWPAPSASEPAAAAQGEAGGAAPAPSAPGPASTPATSPPPAGEQAPAASSEEERTEILHPHEPDG